MKKRVVLESYLKLPWCSMGKSKQPRPSYTDEELFDFVGNRGVYSDEVRYFKYCFREIVHRSGYILYRMKPTADYNIIIKTPEGNERSTLDDPMEVFRTRESFVDPREVDNLVIARTHNVKTGEPEDVIETWCTVPFNGFSKYLDPSVPMDDFEGFVTTFLDIQQRVTKRAKTAE
jgi:hypothetical protein